MAKLSPMMEQYFQIKQNYPDTLLFFRLGDFYEMFFDDAKIASKELELVLTGRDCGQEERAPMCGVPFHSADSYIAKLVGRGYKVAICEQVEDPKTAKGLVRREVTRIITPGTVTEDGLLDETKNNYIIAVCRNSLSALDLATGDFFVEEFDSKDKLDQAIIKKAIRPMSKVIMKRHLKSLKMKIGWPQVITNSVIFKNLMSFFPKITLSPVYIIKVMH